MPYNNFNCNITLYLQEIIKLYGWLKRIAIVYWYHTKHGLLGGTIASFIIMKFLFILKSNIILSTIFSQHPHSTHLSRNMDSKYIVEVKIDLDDWVNQIKDDLKVDKHELMEFFVCMFGVPKEFLAINPKEYSFYSILIMPYHH